MLSVVSGPGLIMLYFFRSVLNALLNHETVYSLGLVTTIDVVLRSKSFCLFSTKQRLVLNVRHYGRMSDYKPREGSCELNFLNVNSKQKKEQWSAEHTRNELVRYFKRNQPTMLSSKLQVVIVEDPPEAFACHSSMGELLLGLCFDVEWLCVKV
jgi:hypothetical protein